MPYLTIGIRDKALHTFHTTHVCRLELSSTVKLSVGDRTVPCLKIYLSNQIANAIVVDYDYAQDGERVFDRKDSFNHQPITVENCFALAESDFNQINTYLNKSIADRLEAWLQHAIRNFLGLFDQYEWARKRLGGHWERWYVDHPVCSDIWHSVDTCTKKSGKRPTPICRGTPECKDYDE